MGLELGLSVAGLELGLSFDECVGVIVLWLLLGDLDGCCVGLSVTGLELGSLLPGDLDGG